jgi:ribonuclease J
MSLNVLGMTRGVLHSCQNIDRTVTLYRAAKRSDRTLIIDLYTADVLDSVSIGTRLPRAGSPNLKVVITGKLQAAYRRLGREEFVERMVPFGVAAQKLVGGRDVIMLRSALVPDYERAGVLPDEGDAYNFSMWKGYLLDPYHSAALDWCKNRGTEIAYIHTSGHASAADLRAFSAAMQPKVVIPVHGANWDSQAHRFANIRRLSDAEQFAIR